MIRHRHGSDFFLFMQHDHALLAGQIAEQVGGSLLARPSPQTIQGIALHDCGWPLHDDHPTLNPAGEPLHVFETPPAIATQVWSASSRQAAEKDPYSGLLVSLHVLALSGMSQQTHHSPHDVFELNKFQHAQIELQEHLRPRLGLRIDQPLNQGLAVPGTSPAEDALLFDFRLLRAMDVLSLSLLCSEKLNVSMNGLQSRAGGPGVDIRIDRPAEFVVRLDPWPFESSPVRFEVPFRRVPARQYADRAEFHSLYQQAAIEGQTVRVEKL
jgi:hypothetical protein